MLRVDSQFGDDPSSLKSKHFLCRSSFFCKQPAIVLEMAVNGAESLSDRVFFTQFGWYSRKERVVKLNGFRILPTCDKRVCRMTLQPKIK